MGRAILVAQLVSGVLAWADTTASPAAACQQADAPASLCGPNAPPRPRVQVDDVDAGVRAMASDCNRLKNCARSMLGDSTARVARDLSNATLELSRQDHADVKQEWLALNYNGTEYEEVAMEYQERQPELFAGLLYSIEAEKGVRRYRKALVEREELAATHRAAGRRAAMSRHEVADEMARGIDESAHRNPMTTAVFRSSLALKWQFIRDQLENCEAMAGRISRMRELDPDHRGSADQIATRKRLRNEMAKRQKDLVLARKQHNASAEARHEGRIAQIWADLRHLDAQLLTADEASERARLAVGIRNDLQCQLRRRHPRSRDADLLERWPGCGCAGGRGRLIEGICLKPEEGSSEDFANSPIDARLPEKLKSFVSSLKDQLREQGFELVDLDIMSCGLVRLETAGRARAAVENGRINLDHVSEHAAGAACDFRSYTVRSIRHPEQAPFKFAFDGGSSNSRFSAQLSHYSRMFNVSSPYSGTESNKQSHTIMSSDTTFETLKYNIMSFDHDPPLSAERIRELERTKDGQLLLRIVRHQLTDEEQRDYDNFRLGVNAAISLKSAGFASFDPFINGKHEDHFHFEVATDMRNSTQVKDSAAGARPTGVIDDLDFEEIYH